MANYIVTDTELTGIADAIRNKSGNQETLSFPTGFTGAINNLGGQDYTVEDALISGTITTYANPRVSNIKYGCFQHMNNLQKIELSTCTTFGQDSFYQCPALQEIWLRSSTFPNFASQSWPEQFIVGNAVVYVPANLVHTYRQYFQDSGDIIYHIQSEEDYPVTNFDTIKDSLSDFYTKLANGTADYEIGDFKTIPIGSENIRFQIVGKNLDLLTNENGNATYTWLAMDSLSTKYSFNTVYGTKPNYSESDIRTILYSTIWNDIPLELKSIIKEVKKYTCSYNLSSEDIIYNNLTNETIWIPSHREIYGDDKHESSGVVYSNFLTNIRQLKRHPSNSVLNSDWMLRSASTTNNKNVRKITNVGYDSSTSVSTSLNIILGFCT